MTTRKKAGASPPPPKETPPAPTAWGPRAGIARDARPRTLAGQTALRIRQDIIRNRFEPGERLTIEKLAALYQVGASPLREALFQAAGDGLVRIEDHKGFVVAPLHLAEMWDVSSLRAYLEIGALQRSIELGGEEWETAVLIAEHRIGKAEARLLGAGAGDLPAAEDEWEARHREFHYALSSACGSPWMLHFFDALYDQLERYRRRFWRYQERAGSADDQHRKIKDAALQRDAALATRLLTEHFQRQAELSAVASEQAGAEPAVKAAAAGKAKTAPRRAR
jgi:DNA-binding GntR family transcriptional regulator